MIQSLVCCWMWEDYLMWDTAKVNTVRKDYRTGRLSMERDRAQFLWGLGIRVPGSVVQAVIDCCSGTSGLSLYQLYTKRRPTYQASKPTIYKIKDIYDSGELADYVQYLHSERLASISEVDAPVQLNASRTIRAAKSDGLRPGVLVRFPPLSFASAIQRFLDNEQAKYSNNLDNINKTLQAHIARQLNV